MPEISAAPAQRAAQTRHLRLAAALIALAWIVPAGALSPLSDFKTDSYLGSWYEIAAIRGFLQSKCARDTRTDYSTDSDGAFALNSSCMRVDGSAEHSESRARPLDPTLPSVLKITSVHLLGIWWYPFGRESIVIARGPESKWIVTAHPSLRYARILSREPAFSDDSLKAAANALNDSHFDLCALTLTPQTGGRDKGGRLCDAIQ